MNTHVAQHPPAVSLSRFAQWHKLVAQLEAWLLARRTAAADRAALCSMSARELRDIGLDPGCARNHGEGDWVRDWS